MNDQTFALVAILGSDTRAALLQRHESEAPAEKPWSKPTTVITSEWHDLPDVIALTPEQFLTSHPTVSLLCVFEDGAIRDGDNDALDIDWGCISTWQQGPHGAVRVRIPPFDVADSGHFDRLPEIPGATVTVQFTLEDGPFGDLDYLMRIVDGRIDAVESAWTADAQVFITTQWTTYLELRLARADPVEAAGKSVIKGEMARLSVLAGVMESEPFVTARRENAEMMAALIDLGTAAPAQVTLNQIQRWRTAQ